MIDKIDREVIKEKFRELGFCLKELAKLKNVNWDEYSSSLTKQWSVFYGLQLAIQILIDVGNHILAGIGENKIEEYVDIIDKLGERGIIPFEFSRLIREWQG